MLKIENFAVKRSETRFLMILARRGREKLGYFLGRNKRNPTDVSGRRIELLALGCGFDDPGTPSAVCKSFKYVSAARKIEISNIFLKST